MKERILLSIVLLAFFVGSIQAWGPDGHKIVARVAEAFLSPTAKQFVDAQLEGDIFITGLESLANLPDTYLYEGEGGSWSASSHYNNLLPNADKFSIWPLCKDNKGCVVSGCYNYTLILEAQRKTNDIEHCSANVLTTPPCALSFLTHYVGDIHQPMHSGYASDLGGNLFYLKFFGSSSQLHRVWDSELIKRYQEQEGMDWKQFSSELIEILQDNPKTLKSFQSDLDPLNWASESFEIMRKNCYNFQPSLKALDLLGVFSVDDNLEKIVDSPANSINIQQQSDDDEDDDQVEGIWKKGIAEKIKSHLLRVFSDEDYELQAACTADVEEMYFLRNLPLIKKRLAQGGARLAGLLNAIYQPNSPNHHDDDDDDDDKNSAYPGMSKIISRALKMKGDFDSYVNSPQGQNSRPLTEVKKCPSNIPVWDKGCPCDSYPCFPISFAPIVN